MTKGIWNRSHYLDRMTLKELWIAYFQYPAIIAYVAQAALSVGVWSLYPATPQHMRVDTQKNGRWSYASTLEVGISF